MSHGENFNDRGRMLLADTNIFIDFLRQRTVTDEFAEHLSEGEALLHPYVEGELYLSGINAEVKDLLHYLPRADVVDHQFVLRFIERYAAKIRGVGYVDIHLLLSATQMGAKLMTRDQYLLRLLEEIPHI
jgi:predicted nucleic acid-binding protein